MKAFFGSLVFLVSISVAATTVDFATVLDIAQKLGAFDTEIHPDLELREANESDNIKAIAQLMFSHQMKIEPQSRDAHAKGHACASATINIEENIPENLRAGVFAAPGTYKALIRFSNGAGVTQTDALPDGRGMAIKIINGAKNGNILGTGNTQDIMMINSPQFFIRNIGDYLLFASVVAELKADEQPVKFFLIRGIREALTESLVTDGETYPMKDVLEIAAAIGKIQEEPLGLGKVVTAKFGWKAASVLLTIGKKLVQMRLNKAPMELAIAQQVAKTSGPLIEETYFSMSSYLSSSGIKNVPDTAIKYSAKPYNCSNGQFITAKTAPTKIEENFLRNTLIDTLATTEKVCFGLYVQPVPASADDEKKKVLVEDPRLKFETKEILVATISIPKQDVGSDAKQAYCENLSFNPWQADSGLRPLGGLNRARKVAVTASSLRRHFVTGQERQEPVTVDDFNNLK